MGDVFVHFTALLNTYLLNSTAKDLTQGICCFLNSDVFLILELDGRDILSRINPNRIV